MTGKWYNVKLEAVVEGYAMQFLSQFTKKKSQIAFYSVY